MRIEHLFPHLCFQICFELGDAIRIGAAEQDTVYNLGLPFARTDVFSLYLLDQKLHCLVAHSLWILTGYRLQDVVICFQHGD